MRPIAKIIAGVALMAMAICPAMAREPFSGYGVNVSPTDYPGAPKPVHDDGNQAPYAMTYTDEAAQGLGVHDGHMEVFSAKPDESQSYLPALSGGLGSDGAMLKLQWHPGE